MKFFADASFLYNVYYRCNAAGACNLDSSMGCTSWLRGKSAQLTSFLSTTARDNAPLPARLASRSCLSKLPESLAAHSFPQLAASIGGTIHVRASRT